MKNTQNYTWLIDPVHSRMKFVASYLMISNVSGWFRNFEGVVISQGDDFSGAVCNIKLYTHSLFTGNKLRDNHLRSADFLDAENFPAIHFYSDNIQEKEGKLLVEGRLAIKNHTQRIDFIAAYSGIRKDEMGNEKAGFSMETTLNRDDFDVSWNQVFGNNLPLISKKITILCEVQLIKIRG